MKTATINNAPNSLLFASNLHGRLKDEIIGRIEIFLLDPNHNNWKDIRGIIITNNFISIWNAVCDLDESYTESSITPAAEIVIQAINNKVFKRVLNYN